MKRNYGLMDVRREAGFAFEKAASFIPPHPPDPTVDNASSPRVYNIPGARPSSSGCLYYGLPPPPPPRLSVRALNFLLKGPEDIRERDGARD